MNTELVPSPADRGAIVDLFARYCWAMNTGDADGFVTNFASDAIFEHLPNPPLRGHAEIRNMLDYLWYDRPGWYIGRQHHATNYLIEVDGDSANVKAYWQMVQWEQDARRRMSMGSLGHWEGHAVRSGRRWLWQSLRVVPWENNQLPWVGDESAKYRFAPPSPGGFG